MRPKTNKLSLLLTSSKKSISVWLVLGLLICVFFSCDRKPGDQPSASEFEINKQYKRGPMEISLRVSKKEITIAEKIDLELEVLVNEDYEVELPKFGDKLEQFGIVDYHTVPPQLVGKERISIRKAYELEPFLSGEYKIPPMKVLFWKKGESDPKKHELETEELIINVKSILPEQFKEIQIKEIVDPFELPTQPFRWITLLVIIVAVVSTAGGIIWWRRRRKTDVEKVKISPHELAYQRLEQLISEKLIEKGEIKLFYTRVCDILRYYIEERFVLHAPERTTEEFMEELRINHTFDTKHKKLLEDFLSHCDLVKFAELQPANKDIQNTFDSCKRFVEETKETFNTPVLVPQSGHGVKELN